MSTRAKSTPTDTASDSTTPKTKKTKAAEGDPLADDDTKKKTKPTDAPLVRSKFQDMKGCSCTVGKETRQLALRVDTSGVGMTVGEDDGFVANFDLSWLVDTGKDNYFLLRSDDASSPPAHVKGKGIAVGVACNGDVFAVIAKNKVSGWSISTKKPLWDATLDADYSLAVSPAQKGLNIQCAAIDASKGSLKVPLVGGKTKAIDIKTGK